MATNVTVPQCSAHVSASEYNAQAQANFDVTSWGYYKVESAQFSCELVWCLCHESGKLGEGTHCFWSSVLLTWVTGALADICGVCRSTAWAHNRRAVLGGGTCIHSLGRLTSRFIPLLCTQGYDQKFRVLQIAERLWLGCFVGNILFGNPEAKNCALLYVLLMRWL